MHSSILSGALAVVALVVVGFIVHDGHRVFAVEAYCICSQIITIEGAKGVSASQGLRPALAI